jgi:hypothetical protein
MQVVLKTDAEKELGDNRLAIIRGIVVGADV